MGSSQDTKVWAQQTRATFSLLRSRLHPPCIIWSLNWKSESVFQKKNPTVFLNLQMITFTVTSWSSTDTCEPFMVSVNQPGKWQICCITKGSHATAPEAAKEELFTREMHSIMSASASNNQRRPVLKWRVGRQHVNKVYAHIERLRAFWLFDQFEEK